ncbi:SymE family type I addiction module toxin [Pantoea sp. CCBC3-3-1]|uniref:SymE family type I addiction module toxin n=1 Tax=Pantoea sp. CCBC3-3-1 TaxID=2490851 RepID=UPI0011BF179E|nr:SymE family type I addiction module toxin [Pantoea sp. CCBC3-3-1]
MDETYHKPEIATPATRCYTVDYISDAKYRPVPVVTLKGHWLKETGFDTGTALEVKILLGCLILAAQEPQPESPAEAEVVFTLRKGCKKLSGRKQREMAAFNELVATPQRRPRKVQ